MRGTVEERRLYSDERFKQLSTQLSQSQTICSERACIYAIGSFGRREATCHSDIDLFIVSLGAAREHRHWLSKLDEILIKADLIRTAQSLGFPPFSGDGRYLQHHTVQKLIATTGTEEDDATNTFTARLLLLLESRPLVSADVHTRVINEVIAKYWREFPGRDDRFMPAYLSNDILRYWRTLCLNYEARTSEQTPAHLAKRRLANYKLKHSRMLTCYSALLFLLSTYVRNRTVTVADAQEMVQLAPICRIESVSRASENNALRDATDELLELYDRFLSVTNASEEDLIRLFSDDSERKRLREEQSRFGDLVYQALYSVGHGNRFYRRFVV